MANYGANVQCPFYMYDKGTKISCEGCSGCGNIQIEFRNRRALVRVREDMCSQRFEDCGIYRMLDSLYDERGRRHELT